MASVLFLVMIASMLRHARPALWRSGGIAAAALSCWAAAALPVAARLAQGTLPGAAGWAGFLCLAALGGLGAWRVASDIRSPPERAAPGPSGPSRLGPYGDLFSAALAHEKARMGVPDTGA